MSKDSSANCYKNAICASVGLLIIFTTSIFVAKDYYGQRIASLIDEATLLKDYRYSDWGQHPGNIDAEYTYNYTFYDQAAGDEPSKISPVVFNHSFNFKDISFGQGNQGFIKYLHNWDLSPLDTIPAVSLNTINLPAEKVYAYERLAPPARRFAVLYNALWKTVEQQLLPFFAAQLHAFYFKHQQTVYDAVFTEAGLEPTAKDAIYNNDAFGWNKVETFQTWVMLAHQKNRTEFKQYELIQEAFGLSAQQLDRLVGDHSMLNTVSAALNGTIRLILENARTYAFGKCVPFCSNDQLVAFELLTGALTANPVFVNVNLKSSLRDLNATLPADVEFNKYCPDPFECPLDDNILEFFNSGHLGNFTTMAKVYANIDNLQIVQGLFELPDTSYVTNVLGYMKYLEQNIFNPTHPTTQKIDLQAYDYMLNNHLYINSAINTLKDILNIEIHTRAMAQLISNEKIKCEDFFTGNYASFVDNCKNKQLDLTQISALRTYVKAFFFQNRASFAKTAGMTTARAGQFLRIDANSPFAAKMKNLRVTLAANFKCSGIYCSQEELLAMEWSGEEDVLSRLPKDLFPTSPASINEWDIEKKLGGVQPQYYKIVGEKLPTAQGKLLLGSGPESILVLFNLLSLKTQTDAGDAAATKLVNYVQRVTIDVFFGGPTSPRSLADVLQGIESEGIREKQRAEPLLGGAPWLASSVQIIKSSDHPSAFSKVSTGIYDRNSLRTMLQVERSSHLGSQLTLFESEFEEVYHFLSSGRSVFGTNLLGFHSDISSSQSLPVLLQFAYQGVVLVPTGDTASFNGVEGLRYAIKPVEKAFIGFNEQNERLVSINSESYFIVDPITGNTLQFSVKFTVSSLSSFLKYYPAASIEEKKLFDCQVYYSRQDVSAISEIANEKSSLRTVYIITIVLASVSMISIVVFAVIYRLKSKSRSKELNDTLISSQASSSIKV